MSYTKNTRREFIKNSSLATIALGLGNQIGTAGAAQSRGNSDKPNILFIFTDQHRLSAVGAYGAKYCKTPNIDKLAAKGMLFRNTYTSCPMCSPARGTIMTGRYVHKHNINANCGEYTGRLWEIPDNKNILSRRLESAGYQCGYTGKWHLGTDAKDTALPTNRGFIGMDVPGHGDGGHRSKGYQEYLRKNNYKRNMVPGERPHKITGRYGVEKGGIESCVPHYLAEHTISLIDDFSKKNQPFFIWHNFWGPHEPYYPPQEFIDMYKDVHIPEWENFNWKPDNEFGPHRMKRHALGSVSPWSVWEEGLKHYYAFTTYIDYEIGRLMEHLENKGLADNTIVIFSSDHGETLGSHNGMVDKGWSHFEEIQRVPLIVKDPRMDKSQTGKEVDKLISQIDIYPTILDYAGADYDKNIVDGASVKPFVDGRKVEWRDSVIVEFFGIGNMATNMLTCRYENYKYGYTCSNKDELYDLEKDPHEMTNLIDDENYADVVEMMRKRIYTFMCRTHYPGRNYFPGTRLFGYKNHMLENAKF
ncbi:Arylsulfatase [Limihaloglobus sulfuriphilus]|uniref:Arylsulfatase n=1 Tax=Limihaloglobus sulfuriphilus TaxID=1851148 RepID=A0A1Q2MC26_9BACT|nr:sulfatase-like hydrolase/transferase [Limihaloglobus sulfuriphilus]AQQ70231.1 Arylsulfatase [Limihaloglobus sulfuriphilus]